MVTSNASVRILIVDDDAACRAILSKLLVFKGYEVHVAESGSRALELAHEVDFDLAILDYRMPEMDGVELFQRMREFRPALVGIFLTGYTTIDTVYPAVSSGIERVLAKPVDTNELLDVIKQLVATAA